MKRPAIPMRVKLEVVLRQHGRCACGCGEWLEKIEYTDFDHQPALCFRARDEVTGKYDPPANDPNRIFAKLREHHKKKTFGSAATSAGSDIHMNAKVNNPKRVAKFVVDKRPIGEPRAASDRPKHKLQSRGFDKTFKRPMDPRKRPVKREPIKEGTI